MTILKKFDRVIQYFSGALARIFGLNDDAYPNVGVQPFEGTYKKRSRSFDS